MAPTPPTGTLTAARWGETPAVPVDCRGGFVTRPAFNGKGIPENRSALAVLFLSQSQGGLQTRPYVDDSTNKWREHRAAGTTQGTVNPINRRSGESRNPGNPPVYGEIALGGWLDRLTMSGLCQGNRVLTGATQGTVIPSNRRSGESRNPGNPREKNGLATEDSGFRPAPERRFYDRFGFGFMLLLPCPSRRGARRYSLHLWYSLPVPAPVNGWMVGAGL